MLRISQLRPPPTNLALHEMSPIASTSTIPAPSPAVTQPERSSFLRNATNPVDDFFGYTLASSSTRDSRHDRRISAAESLAPPSYDEAPEYTQKPKEPVTLAMYLFKFGFRTCDYFQSN